MNRKTFLIVFTSVFSLLLISSIVLIKTGQFTNERTVMDLVEKHGYFKRSEPLVVESLVTGSISKSTIRFYDFNYKDEVRIELTKADTKELVDLLSRTKAKRTIETFGGEGERFHIHLNNNGYTMPYQLDVALTLQLNEEENAMIVGYADGYITEDLTIYKKLNELIEKYSVK